MDQAFASLRAPSELPLPKGLSASTLDSVQDFMKQQSGAVSASEVMDALGMSRVTARRYLEYLADAGTVTRTAALRRAGQAGERIPLERPLSSAVPRRSVHSRQGGGFR